MQVTFIILVVVGILYFLFSKRFFDLFSIAFFSACVYFLPGFWGYVLIPESSVKTPVPLVAKAYLVMIAVLFAILIGGIYFDKTIKTEQIKLKIRGSHLASSVATLIALLGFILTMLTVGSVVFSANKNELLAELNRWFILWEIGASLGAVLSFAQSRWILLFICISLLFFEMYIGFRSGFVTTIIAIFTIGLSDQGRQRVAIKNWRICSVGLATILFIFVYKFLYQVIKLGEWGIVAERLQNPRFYFLTITESEPFTTQCILNEVLRTNFTTGMNHLLGVIHHFIIFSPELGFQITSFNDMFQPELFPEVKSGMANNIWAEMWSSGGWILLLFFIVMFVVVLFLGSYYLLCVRDVALKGCIVLMSSYWAFYIHRNDLLYQINLEKRVLVIWLLCIIISELLCMTSKTKKIKY
ncbi:MAG: hypothetical protein F6K36_18645 [Symploca sp. SIO3C6]|uniref:Oligosaccharide repeat unit polymerase n=1 Tax=Symploca sp. SIO1C4 TaxID=2607765 RepID=A0A6B3NBE0_9CYAN|nr:hypothetical protein [Symploca sp. SIO3C6]NER26498.1 hypothetical protein [Symploca sp. SIO1C4]